MDTTLKITAEEEEITQEVTASQAAAREISENVSFNNLVCILALKEERRTALKPFSMRNRYFNNSPKKLLHMFFFLLFVRLTLVFTPQPISACRKAVTRVTNGKL